MSSDLAILAEQVVLAINAAPPAPGAIAVLRMSPVMDIEKMGDDILLSVIPRSLTPTPGTRDDPMYDLAIDVGVQRRLNPDDLPACVAMLTIVQAIITRLYRGNLPALPGLRPISIENDPAFAADHLANFSVFTSVPTITYRVALQ